MAATTPDDPRLTSQLAWRDRIPEAAAAIGATLVGIAGAGFVTSSWTAVSHGTQAVILGAAAAGLTTAGIWAERFDRRGLSFVTSLVLLAATAMVTASATLGAAVAVPGRGRVAIAIGGVAGLAHALTLLRRRRGSGTQAAAAWATGVWAIGPFGAALSDRFGESLVDGLLLPVSGFFDPTVTSDLHVVPGIGHLLVGVATLAAMQQAQGRARQVLRALAIVTVGFAALELNVIAAPIGAVAALGVVIGFLLYGLATDDGVLLVSASIGAMAAGTRVLFAVFTGEVVATIAVLGGGLVLLAWAVRTMQAREAATPEAAVAPLEGEPVEDDADDADDVGGSQI